jgi:hypothetical protein
VTDDEQDWTPTFPGQRPPFQPGNTYGFAPGNQHAVGQGNSLAVVHGAYSPAVIEPRARELLEATLADPQLAYLDQPAYAPVLRNWATVQARAEVFGEWLADQDPDQQITPPRGGAKSPLDTYLGMVRTSTGLADRLGLTPLSRARLGKDLAVTGAANRSGLANLQALGSALLADAERTDQDDDTAEIGGDAEETDDDRG